MVFKIGLNVVGKIITYFPVRNQTAILLVELSWLLFDLCDKIFSDTRHLVWIPLRLTDAGATWEVSSPTQIFIHSCRFDVNITEQPDVALPL
jgi:hypothetical protein